MTPPTPAAGAGAEYARTSRIVLTGLWADAVLVMAASAYNGGQAFTALGQHTAAGIALGLAVDVALAVALVGDRALHLAGRQSYWGRALRVSTAIMSLALNCAVALWHAQYGVAVFHAFLPVLLVLLSEYAQDSTLQFGQLATEHETATTAERQARLAAERATWESAQDQRMTSTPPVFPTVVTPRPEPAPIPPALASRFQAVPSGAATDHARPGPDPVDHPTGRPAHQHAVVSGRPDEQPMGRPDTTSAGHPARRPGQWPAARPDTTARTSPTPRPTPSRSGRQRTSQPITDERLAEVIREMTARNGGRPPSQYQLRQAHGIGGPRAARLLAELTTTPTGPLAGNGAVTRKDSVS